MTFLWVTKRDLIGSKHLERVSLVNANFFEKESRSSTSGKPQVELAESYRLFALFGYSIQLQRQPVIFLFFNEQDRLAVAAGRAEFIREDQAFGDGLTIHGLHGDDAGGEHC